MTPCIWLLWPMRSNYEIRIKKVDTVVLFTGPEDRPYQVGDVPPDLAVIKIVCPGGQNVQLCEGSVPTLQINYVGGRPWEQHILIQWVGQSAAQWQRCGVGHYVQ